MTAPTAGQARALNARHWDCFDDGARNVWRWDELAQEWHPVRVGDVCRQSGGDRLSFGRWTGSSWSPVEIVMGSIVLATTERHGLKMTHELCYVDDLVVDEHGWKSALCRRRNDMGGDVVEIPMEWVLPVVDPGEFSPGGWM